MVFIKSAIRFGEVGVLIVDIIIYGIVLKSLPRRRIKSIIKFKPGYIIFGISCVIIKVGGVIINNAIIVSRINGCVINNIIKLLNIIDRFIFLS